MPTEIKFFDRFDQSEKNEQIYGDGAVRFFYENPIGKILSSIISLKIVSYLYGLTQDSASSAKKIPNFIKKFKINMDEYLGGSNSSQEKEDSYKSFNEFFIRKFKDGKRDFDQDKTQLPAFCEARYFGYNSLDSNSKFPVKGNLWNAKSVLQRNDLNEIFENGPALIARLCPVDYHRYHYPDDGKNLESYFIRGPLHSVNPLALNVRPKILMENERRVSILETENFGKLAFVEVGATCVGRIVQSHDENIEFKRAQEKGYFLFGGSTVIVFGQKGKWEISEDIRTNTLQGREVLVRLGQAVAIAKS